jgi:hypothetical protein
MMKDQMWIVLSLVSQSLLQVNPNIIFLLHSIYCLLESTIFSV